MSDTPAWPMVQHLLDEAANWVEALPAQRDQGVRALAALDLDDRSTLGAVALHAGGLRVDGGWLRVLGSGHPKLPGSLLDWNGLAGDTRPAVVAGALVVAHDLVGGVYAVNAGGLPGEEGRVNLFSLQTRRWEDLGVGYTGFLRWVCDGDLAGLYNDLRWPDWEEDAALLGGDQGLHLWPPPWTLEGRDVSAVSRRVVDMGELVERIFTGRPPPPEADH